ncbi:MAG: TfoX/Sxy family protein [Verrucomicrobiota bacterium]
MARKKKAAPEKKAKSGKSAPKAGSELGALRNIGRTIQRRLVAVEITTEKQLRKTGAVEAYQKIREAFPKETIPVCYYLYSLQGALMNCHWDALPEETKKRLRRRAGVDEKRPGK